MALSKAEKQEFLSQPHIAAFSVVEPGRGPLTVPVWYDYKPGGRPTVILDPKSRKMRAIEAAGRFTLMVDTVTPRTMYVSVEGPVVEVRPTPWSEFEYMAGRYLEGEAFESYLKFSEQQEMVTVTLEPEHWLGLDLTR
ncbi:pyridoxamine 5-phosphate oxidase [Tsukamurella sputi]|uniref:Pyridoxamine 5-phosphate oxidase n=1 Tax=Tsukamurella sputi TaxID=2591848 RepID=A0A5C5RVR7_9ACTN|nr:pyridoxamine 5'-phosphate oxidase family protein [Tsukamurella sputi]TWS26295.1 pyridoxamine 5-phosphate oxidase [Tsukamurella sputi]